MKTGLIGVICVALILIGMVFGFIRGWKNSLIRFAEVIVCAFISYFVASGLAGAFMSLDLSATGITVSGINVSTLEQTLTDLIGSISIVSELMDASPTLSAIVAIIPLLIVSMVLFVIVFFIIKFVAWIIHAIVGAIIRKKLKARDEYNDDADGKKIWGRLAGCGIGILQGIFCFAVIMIPVAGSTYFLADEVAYIRQYENGTIQENGAIASVYASEDTEKDDLKEAEETLNNINRRFRGLTLFGYKKISMNAVQGLTTFELNNVETSLTAEIDNVVKIYVRIDDMVETPVDKWTEKEITAGREAVELFFASPITGDIATEMIQSVAESWTEENTSGQTFVGVMKPEITDEGGQKVFDVFLNQLKTNQKEDMKGEFNAVLSVVEVAVDNEIIGVAKSSTTAEDVMGPVSKDGVVSDVIGAMAGGRAVRNTLPTLVQFGLDQMYPMIGVDESVYKDFKVTKASSEIDWETEKVYLGNAFTGLARTYLSLQKCGEVLSKLDYESLAFALDNLRASQLLSSQQANGNSLSKEITLAILHGAYLEHIDGMDGVLNSIEADYEHVNFYSLLRTLKASVELAESMQKVNDGHIDELPSEQVSDLLHGLQDETTGKLMKDLVSTDNLTGLGVDEAFANAVGSLVGAVVDYNAEAEDVGDESIKMPTEQAGVDAATEAFKSLSNVVQSGNVNAEATENRFFMSKEEMKNFILDLQKSPYVYQITLSQSQTLGFKDEIGNTKLTDTEYGYLEELMEEDSEAFKEREMVNIFGVRV